MDYVQDIREYAKKLENTAPVKTDFRIGDVVTFTNDNGVEFKDCKIVGFSKDTSFYGRFIHIDTECYWFPKRPSQLKKQICS